MTEVEQESWEQEPDRSGVETALNVSGFVLIVMGVLLGLGVLIVLAGTNEFLFFPSRYRPGLEFARVLWAIWTALFHIVPGLICLGMGKGIRVLKEIRSASTTEDAAAA